MKKAIASGLIGLIALGGGVVAAAPAFAQEADDATTEARQAERSERKAEKVDTLSGLLGITADEFQAAKEAGQSVADIAAAEGVDLQTVIDSLVANAQVRIDAKVAAGDIDADRAAEKADSIEERITARVNGEGSERGHHGNRGARGASTTTQAGV